MTAELVDLAAEDARERLDRVRAGVERIWDDLVALYAGRAWLSLGYSSWDALCDAELDGARIALPACERREVVVTMRQAGMSTRAIGAALGVSHPTVRRDLNSDPTGTDVPLDAVPIVGVNGKTYQPKSTVILDELRSSKPVAEPWDPFADLTAHDLEVVGYALRFKPLNESINHLEQIAQDAKRQRLPDIVNDDGEAIPLDDQQHARLSSIADSLRATSDHINEYLGRTSK